MLITLFNFKERQLNILLECKYKLEHEFIRVQKKLIEDGNLNKIPAYNEIFYTARCELDKAIAILKKISE